MTLAETLRKHALTLRAHLQRGHRHLCGWLWQRSPQPWRRPHEVVDHFDTWDYLADLQRQLSELLTSAGVDHLVVDKASASEYRIAVRHPDGDRVLAALADSSVGGSWWVAPSRAGLIGRARPVGRRRWRGVDGVLISRNLLSGSGIPLTHSELGVLIEFWAVADVPTHWPGGTELPSGTIFAPTANGVLGYIDAHQWVQAQRDGHRLPVTPPHLLTLVEPVDLVYTWVDGNDPAWLARKEEALGLAVAARYSSDATIDARFANRDELRYSLRSVEMFASWVRHIWVVTDGQAPEWLRPDDRLSIVDHREIFADSSALPVFNSHAIESQLHHINGLAEHYLYLNDDMLFGAPVRPDDFFNGAGLIKIFISRAAVIDPAARNEDDLAVSAAAKNNREFLEREFGRTITHKTRHTPQAHIRSVMEEFERLHPALFDDVMRSRFRSAADLALTSALDGYYAMANGFATPSNIRYGYLDLASIDAWKVLELWLRRRNLKCMCINDSGAETPEIQRANDVVLREFFEDYYPVRSRWE